MHRVSSRLWPLLLGLALVAAACSSQVIDNAGETGDAATEPVEQQTEEAEVPADVPNTEPVVTPGATTTGSVVIDGVTIEYATSVPVDFAIGDEAPLLLAFPPGGQDLGLTESLTAQTYGPEAQRLGWVVVSPAAPNSELFFNGSETLVPGFLDWVETWVTPEGGAPHVAGVSNGGISSFRYAALNPDRIQSLVGFPGFPRSDADRAALSELTDIPIRLFVGGEDTNWIGPAMETVEAFRAAGGDIEATVFEGEGHVMSSTQDGTIIFTQLESFRAF